VQGHLNREQLKKTVGMRMQIQPIAHRLDDAEKLLPPIDDDWVIESVTEEGVRISNPRNGLSTLLGLDHIYSFTSNPGRMEGGSKFGFLVLKVQLTLKRHEVIVRPTLRPGESVPPPPQTNAPESASDRLARLAAEKAFEQQTEFLATGAEALHAVQANREALYARISDAVSTHAGKGAGSLHGEAGIGSGVYGANLGRIGCLINYTNSFGNVTAGSLKIRFLSDRIAIPGTNQVYIGVQTEIVRYEFKVARSRALGWCWVRRGQAAPLTSEQITDFVLDEFARLNR
jgi:hypothetical protein